MATVERTLGSRHATLGRTGGAGQSVLERIGNTPLLRLSFVGRDFPNVEFLAKAEWFNPGGAGKERPAHRMIQAGVVTRRAPPGKNITPATSGDNRVAHPARGGAAGQSLEDFPPGSAA